MTVVSLDMKIVDDEKQMFRVYSGYGRRFFDFFAEHNLVFLEVPDINLSPESFDDVELVRKEVRRSRDIASIIRKQRIIPPILPRRATYNGLPDKNDKSGNSLIGSVTSLYRDAQPGDLIVSPGRGAYKQVLYGEITEEFDSGHAITVEQFGELRIPIRKVRWIRKTPQDELVPFQLSKYVTGRKAVALIKRSEDALSFFDIAYQSYVTGDASRLSVFAPRYDSDSFLATSEINEIVGYLIAASEAVASNTIDQFSPLRTKQAIRRYVTRETLEYYRQNFNSPGASSFRSSAKKLGPAVAICIALAAAGSLAIVAAGGQLEIQSEVPVEMADVCAQYSERVRQMAEAMGVERCTELEADVALVTEELGLQVPASVEDE